ncbi:phage antirepressor KilAC domain-containing protein [Marinobacter sp.]|uniref:phage antirepressor KilAC domain-containing protein n=1 Tax=Marinobacter sp. TaxID=50741 RepID=UPI0035C745D7
MEYTFDQAAALLDTGRNKLARELRRLKMLDQHNMPAGRYRGQGIFVVKTGTYEHPTRGKTPYTKTLITDKGLEIIKFRFEKSCLSSRSERSAGNKSQPQLEKRADLVITPEESSMEKIMKKDSAQEPTGRVHDVGELTVINEDHGRCHHRVAMVVVFDSPEQAQACVKAGTVRLIPSMDLNPDATEAMRHGG